MKDMAMLKEEQKKYTALWPDYCRICGGSGIVICEDSVDYGSTTTTMRTEDNCPACVDEGNCPRCGKGLPESGDLKCEWCGWDEDTESAPLFEDIVETVTGRLSMKNEEYVLGAVRLALAMGWKISIL